MDELMGIIVLVAGIISVVGSLKKKAAEQQTKPVNQPSKTKTQLSYGMPNPQRVPYPSVVPPQAPPVTQPQMSFDMPGERMQESAPSIPRVVFGTDSAGQVDGVGEGMCLDEHHDPNDKMYFDIAQTTEIHPENAFEQETSPRAAYALGGTRQGSGGLSAQEMRRAMVLKEILDPPKARRK